MSRIIIVIGYQGDKLRKFINELHIKTPLVYIENQIYDKTNNIYSLMLANELLCEDDTLLLESDLIFDECVVDILIEDSRGTLALVDKYENWMDGACTILDDNDCIVDFVPGKYLNFEEKERYFKTVNIYKFSTHFSQNTYVPFLKAYAAAMGNNEYYESVIKLIAMLETKEIRAKRLQGQHWYEIDDIQDLDIAESIFARNSNEKYEIMSKRYGGYWRYPHLIDFCYLVNPYFPPRKMIHEIISSFPELLTQYPSGMRVNSLLVAKKFALKQCHIAVGNGAAEIIKSMMEQADFKKVGFIRPTFEEYPNRFCKEAVYYNVKSENFQYSVEDVMMFFDDKDLDALVIINPDNPSGNYLSMSALRKLLLWAQNKEIVMIVDESFVDFVETDNLDGEHMVSLLEEDILEMYPQLFVIKSISKSYGVPGIRLGIIASSDEEMIDRIKADLSIWNINSFAEFFFADK